MRRFHLIDKARSADIIGIVVGTLGVGTTPNMTVKCRLNVDWLACSGLSGHRRATAQTDRRVRQKVLCFQCGEAEPSEVGQFC